jgi:hypothetical protein
MSSNGMAKCVGPANANMNSLKFNSFTFDHRTLRTRLPVRSALFKQRTGGLVVRWVTTGESPLLNVFFLAFCIAVCFTFAGPWSHQVVGGCKLIL